MSCHFVLTVVGPDGELRTTRVPVECEAVREHYRDLAMKWRPAAHLYGSLGPAMLEKWRREWADVLGASGDEAT